jgi:hypothetical protein
MPLGPPRIRYGLRHYQDHVPDAERMPILFISVPWHLIPPECRYELEWQNSGVKDIMIRIDPAIPAMKQRRHVHVAHRKHIRVKAKQASWNDDGTRHDKKTFDESLGSQTSIRAVARAALRLPADVRLEFVAKLPMQLTLNWGDEPLTELDPDVCVVFLSAHWAWRKLRDVDQT